ncbi:MAG: lytic transglycosylase [Candidatus Binatia bacterium]|nr:MAG: lytic transglycosylase [Candidatus Binatia bacterium]
MIVRWLGVLGFVLLVPAARADIYVYTDSRGVMHFSNAPTRSDYRLYMEEDVPPRGLLLGRPAPARLEPIIRAAARRHNVDPALVKAVIRAESDFFPFAKSPKGALGLMQLMPETARDLRVGRIFDPVENVEGGVRHLRRLLDRYRGDVRLALAAYNAGEKAVEAYGGVPPYRETREYVERVLRFREYYARQGG